MNTVPAQGFFVTSPSNPRRSDSAGRDAAARQLPCGRRRWPCAPESHGSVYVGYWMVEKSFSQQAPLQTVNVNSGYYRDTTAPRKHDIMKTGNLPRTCPPHTSPGPSTGPVNYSGKLCVVYRLWKGKVKVNTCMGPGIQPPCRQRGRTLLHKAENPA